MRTFNLIAFLFICINSFSQISINKDDMPNANDTFRLSTTTILNYISTETGEDYIWDFTALTPVNQRVDTFVSVLSTPLTYNLVFNNYLDPNKATIAAQNPNSPNMIQQVQVSESYDFFRETSSIFSKVGFGAQINSIPVPVKYDVPEKYYTFPLSYQTIDSSVSVYGFSIPNIGFYGQTIKRNNFADGWGTITTPFGTFDVIRIISTINLTDTIYYDSLGIGTSIPRSTEFEYKWIAKNMGIPVLKITYRNFIYSVEYQDSLRSTILSAKNIEKNSHEINIYPNPSQKNITLDLPNHFVGIAEIYSINMQLLISKTISKSNESIDLDLKNGTYFIKIITENVVTIKPFIITN